MTRLSTLAFCFSLFSLSLSFASSRVEIREGRFYVDGRPFHVKAMGYAPWRPHQQPGTSYTGTNRRWTDKDFARIKAAHFNTIRTWEPLEAEDLALARQHGLMVLQGVRLDPRQNFSNPHNQETVADQLRVIAEKSRDADNVLGYLIMSRSDPSTVLRSGVEETRQFFRRAKRAIQNVDPRPVALDGWWPIAFLDDTDSDFGAFSAFAFWPTSITQSLGYPGTVRWLAERWAKTKPLLISETGGYAVSVSSRSGAGGSGGWREYDQSMKTLESLRGAVEGHAQGTVIMSWIDGWYAAHDPETHDDDPWEWTGVLAIATDKKSDMDGRPRQLYSDLRDYNQLIPQEPKANHIYPVLDTQPIQAFTSPQTISMRFNLNDGEWQPLEGSGQGFFVGSFTLGKLARRRQRLSLLALDKDRSVLAQKDLSFLASVKAEQVVITPKSTGKKDVALTFTIEPRDGDNRPLPNRKVFIGCFYPISLREAQATLTTGLSGSATFACAAFPTSEDRYVYIAAGTDSPDRARAGDLRIFELGR